MERYEAAKDGLQKLEDKRLERNALMDEFDEGLWITIVDVVTVHSEHEIAFKFKDGMALDWNI